MTEDTTPMVITFSTGRDDKWLRAVLHFEDFKPEDVSLNHVIVQGVQESDRICRALSNYKHVRGKSYGGALTQRLANLPELETAIRRRE